MQLLESLGKTNIQNDGKSKVFQRYNIFVGVCMFLAKSYPTGDFRALSFGFRSAHTIE